MARSQPLASPNQVMGCSIRPQSLRCPTAACAVADRSMFKPDWVGFDPVFTLGQALLYVNKNNYNQKLSKTLSANSCDILQLHPLSNRFCLSI